MIRQITIGAWAAALVVQALILALLVRRGHFRNLPLFTVWIAVDWVRWSIIFAVYTIIGHATEAYSILFAITEPAAMILLAAAGFEAAGMASSGWGLSVAFAVGSAIHFPETALPLRMQFLTRALLAGAAAASLTIQSTLMVLGREAPGWHRTIFLLFCIVDLATYFRIVTLWPTLDVAATQAFVMVGQLCCLISWAIYFRRNRGLQPCKF